MHPKANYLPILILGLFSHSALSTFNPRAEGIPQPNNPAAVLPENHIYGLFDRPAVAVIPIALANDDQQDISAVKAKRADTMTSAAAGSMTSAASNAATPTSAAAAGINSPTPDAAYPNPNPTDSNDLGGLSDTYALPPAYDTAQLSSLFAADSSAVEEANSLLSAFPSESAGIACTGVKDADGAEVTVCGPTGNPLATGLGGGEGTSGAGSLGLGMGLGWEVWRGNASWAFGVLGGVGAVVAFFL